MDSSVLAVKKLFPRHKKEIAELALASEEFRGLCKDLADVENVILYHVGLKSPNSNKIIEEYRGLLKDLEDEIQKFIHDKRIASNLGSN